VATIEAVHARQILDSRGNLTVERQTPPAGAGPPRFPEGSCQDHATKPAAAQT